MKVLPTLIGKMESDQVTAQFFKCVPIEGQQFLSLHLGLSKWRQVANIHECFVVNLLGQHQCEPLSAPLWKRVALEPQHFLVLHLKLSKYPVVAIIYIWSNGHHCWHKSPRYLHFTIMTMRVTGASTMCSLAYIAKSFGTPISDINYPSHRLVLYADYTDWLATM